MNFLRQWAVSVCVCAIVATIFSVLSPSGKMDKLLKLVISVFIMTSLITPFLSMSKREFKENFNMEVTTVDQDELQNKTNDISKKSMDLELQNKIIEFLATRGFEGCTAKVVSSLNDNNEYFINTIDVFIPEEFESSISTISSILNDYYSYNMNVKVKENNE